MRSPIATFREADKKTRVPASSAGGTHSRSWEALGELSRSAPAASQEPPHEGPRACREGPRAPQDNGRSVPERPRTSPGASQEARRSAPRSSHERPQSPRSPPGPWLSRSLFMIRFCNFSIIWKINKKQPAFHVFYLLFYLGVSFHTFF